MKKLSLVPIVAFLLIFVACGGEQSSSAKTTTPAPVKEQTQADPRKAEEKTAEASEPETAAEETPAAAPIPPEQIKRAKEIIADVTEEEIAAVDAKKKFKILCAACHGFTGNLKVNGAKDLTKSKISLEESVAQVYHGRGLMTPFKGLMTDAEIVAVAQYIRKELRK